MRWEVPAEAAGCTVSAFVKTRTELSWSIVKRHVANGKTFVDDERVVDVAHRVRAGQTVELRLDAPRPRDDQVRVPIVYEDKHVVIIDKPCGTSSVPYEKDERDTAMDLLRAEWRRQARDAGRVPLHVVHRIDRATSGLLVFAKSKRAELGLAMQLRDHSMDRSYVCAAHGAITAGRIESRLVRDRGDGLRGTGRDPRRGKLAITHVTVRERLHGATLCDIRLETGKTHQIRIHLAEQGWPLIGETVYIRDYERRGGRPIESPRLLLHAATLGFVHPTTGERLHHTSALPEDFEAVLASLRR
jgi:23S rRNA pseudouridine1911/1915/1917 synthase